MAPAEMESRLGGEPPNPKPAEWLPEPSPDPRLLRRITRSRWEIGAASGAYIGFIAGFLVGWRVLFLLFNGRMVMERFMGGLAIVGFSIIAPLGFLAITILVSRVCLNRAAPCLSDLVDLPAACPQFPVTVAYHIQVPQAVLGSVEYGRDLGLASFVDGYMHFQGRRTSWSLSLCDLGRRWKKVQPFSEELLERFLSTPVFHHVFWTDGPQEYEIHIWPSNRMRDLGAGLAKEFDKSADEWLSGERIHSEAHRLPPVTAVPGLIRKRLAGFRALSAICWIGRACVPAAVFAWLWLDWELPAFAFYLVWLTAEMGVLGFGFILDGLTRVAGPGERIPPLPRGPGWWQAFGSRMFRG